MQITVSTNTLIPAYSILIRLIELTREVHEPELRFWRNLIDRWFSDGGDDASEVEKCKIGT